MVSQWKYLNRSAHSLYICIARIDSLIDFFSHSKFVMQILFIRFGTKSHSLQHVYFKHTEWMAFRGGGEKHVETTTRIDDCSL